MKTEKKKAYDVAPGSAVLFTTQQGRVLAMKAQCQGKDFIRHYLVVFSAAPSMVYLDPDEELDDLGGRMVFRLGEAGPGTRPETGSALVNQQGAFLKLENHQRFIGHKQTVYVDMASGEVRSRQEKGLKSIHPDWRIESLNIGERTLTPDEALID